VLRGAKTLELRRDRREPARRRREPAQAVQAADSPLWEALRQLRKRLADEQGVPPYVIFHDSTLRQMVEERPATREDFAGLSGVGEQKLLRYADPFLEVIRGAAAGAATNGWRLR
jgi:ATP-dependent DNA helicase RecQ